MNKDKIISNMDPYTFTGSAIVIGLLLTKEFTLDEQENIGNWLQLIGLVVLTYATQAQTIESNNGNQNNGNNNQTNKDDIESLQKAIKRIEEELNKIKKESP